MEFVRKLGIILLAGLMTGCTSMVQIPRAEYAAVPERKNVLVRTSTGEQYAFDKVTVTADSLAGQGYQQRTVINSQGEAMLEEYETRVRVPLEQVETLSVRKKDWGRMAKWGIGAAAATAFIVAVGTSGGNDDDAKPGGGKGPPSDF